MQEMMDKMSLLLQTKSGCGSRGAASGCGIVGLSTPGNRLSELPAAVGVRTDDAARGGSNSRLSTGGVSGGVAGGTTHEPVDRGKCTRYERAEVFFIYGNSGERGNAA